MVDKVLRPVRRLAVWLDTPFGSRAEWLVPMSLFLLFKVWLFALCLPERLGEYHIYEGYADVMLRGSEWLRVADLSTAGPMSVHLRKMPGMSLLLAGGKLLCGDAWPYALSLFFHGLSFGVGRLVYIICVRRYGLGERLGLLAALLYLLSTPLTTDVTFWQDGLYGGLTALALCLLLLGAERPGLVLTSGLILMAAGMSRVTVIYATPLLGVISVAWLWRRMGAARAFGRGLLLVLPLLLATGGYMAWNTARTGHPVLTTDSSTAYFMGLFTLYDQNPDVVEDGNLRTVMDGITEQSGRWSSYLRAQLAVQALVAEGLTHIEAAEVAGQVFRRAVVHDPALFLRGVAVRLKSLTIFTASFLSVPLTRLDDLDWIRGRFDTPWRKDLQRVLSGESVTSLAPSTILHAAARLAVRGLGLALMAGVAVYLYGCGARLLRGRGVGQTLATCPDALYLTVVYALFSLSYLSISIEPRYLAPVAFVPGLLLALALGRVASSSEAGGRMR